MKKLNLEISVKYFKDYIITLILQDFFFSIPFSSSNLGLSPNKSCVLCFQVPSMNSQNILFTPMPNFSVTVGHCYIFLPSLGIP